MLEVQILRGHEAILYYDVYHFYDAKYSLLRPSSYSDIIPHRRFCYIFIFTC